MTRGSTHDLRLKQKVIAEVMMTGNKSKVAKKNGLPKSTVVSWTADLEKMSDDEYAQFRSKRKQRFTENCWKLIGKAQEIIEKKLDDDDAVKEMDIGKLSTVMGTMYDKQALASNEATEIVQVKSLEDFAE